MVSTTLVSTTLVAATLVATTLVATALVATTFVTATLVTAAFVTATLVAQHSADRMFSTRTLAAFAAFTLVFTAFSGESYAGSALRASGAIGAPIGFPSACTRYTWLCHGNGGHEMTDEKAMPLLQKVNRQVNAGDGRTDIGEIRILVASHQQQRRLRRLCPTEAENLAGRRLCVEQTGAFGCHRSPRQQPCRPAGPTEIRRLCPRQSCRQSKTLGKHGIYFPGKPELQRQKRLASNAGRPESGPIFRNVERCEQFSACRPAASLRDDARASGRTGPLPPEMFGSPRVRSSPGTHQRPRDRSRRALPIR